MAIGLALLALAAAPTRGEEKPPRCEDPLVARVQTAYQAMRSFAGRFEQEDFQADGTRTLARGRIAYVKPGRMRWDYEPPHEQLVVTDGTTVWLYDPLLDNVTVQALADLTRGTPLAFLLGAGNLAEDFSCRAPTRPPPRDRLSYVELVARKEIPTLAFIQIGVRPQDAALRTLRIVDTQDNVREVRLIDLREGASFPADFFTFHITDEMEVITK